MFNEYFHGDNGAGLGATHQTGWTGLVADLICRPDPFETYPLFGGALLSCDPSKIDGSID